MKVLFLTNIPSPYRVDFFNELGKLCELTVLYERRHAIDRNENWKSNNLECSYKEIFLKGINIGKETSLCISVTKYLKDKRYDLIVVGGYSTPTGMLAIKYLKLKNIPFILNVDGGIINSESKYKFILKKHFISSASAWLSSGKKTNEYLIHYGAKKEKIFIYPFSSLRTKDILMEPICVTKKQELKNKINIKEEKVIISVGQFIQRKGFDILINACKDIDNNSGVYIIGGEPTSEFLELKEKLNLSNVHFIGFKSKDELKQFFIIADIFVLPTREDIWGLVINEAMAHRLPIITTNKCNAGVELVEDHKNGFIIPVEDEKQLVNKINIILSNDYLGRIMAQNNIKKIKEYTIENMAKRHVEIFGKLYKNI